MKDTVASTAPNVEPARKCCNCGVAVGKDAPFGHCPMCLMELGFIPQRKSPSGRLQFGDYELLEQIGRGGMGVVYKARQVSLNRTVAFKMMLDSHLASPVVLERFRIEAEAAAKLHHPNIVPIYEIADLEGHHFFSMRLIEGEGLDQKIKLGEYTVAERGKTRFAGRDRAQEKIAALIATVAKAVHYAHEHGVLHRDLKPSNILIDREGRPYLTDFGLAKITDNTLALTPSRAVMGTPGYMAPEQALGAVSQAAGDIFSLGAIFYELLTGKPPFEGLTAMEILRRTREEEPVNPRRKNGAIDVDLVTICLKCLEKDPGQRYVSAEAFAEDLERWLRNEPIEARPVRMPGRLRRWCRREPMLAAMTFGLIGLVTVVALMTGGLYRREKSNRLGLEQQSAQDLRALMRRMERDRDKGDKALRISAQEIPVLLRQRVLTDGTEKPMILSAITPERNPDRMVLPFAHFLMDLQNRLRTEAELKVIFDLRLYNRAEDVMGTFGEGADLAWIDAAIYVKGRQAFAHLQPIARETYRGGSTLVGAIVTRPDSGITNMAGLKGRSFAFGDKDSALGWYLPKAELVRSGFTRRDLQTTNLPIARVLSTIRMGLYDAGAILESDLKKLREAGGDLRVLAKLPCPSHPWIFISKDIDKKTFDAFETAFLSIQDDTILGRLGSNVTGFVPAKAGDYDELETELKRAEEFDVP